MSWHHSEHMVVLSMWEWDHCRATFRLAPSDVPDLIDLLGSGLQGPAAGGPPGEAGPGLPPSFPPDAMPSQDPRLDGYDARGGLPQGPRPVEPLPHDGMLGGAPRVPFPDEPAAAEAHGAPEPRFGADPRHGGEPRFAPEPVAAQHDTAPPLGSRPPFGGEPPLGAGPPFAGAPPFGSEPPFAGAPPFGSEPRSEHRPAFRHEPPGDEAPGFAPAEGRQGPPSDYGRADDLWATREAPPPPQEAGSYADYRPEPAPRERDVDGPSGDGDRPAAAGHLPATPEPPAPPAYERYEAAPDHAATEQPTQFVGPQTGYEMSAVGYERGFEPRREAAGHRADDVPFGHRDPLPAEIGAGRSGVHGHGGFGDRGGFDEDRGFDGANGYGGRDGRAGHGDYGDYLAGQDEPNGRNGHEVGNGHDVGHDSGHGGRRRRRSREEEPEAWPDWNGGGSWGGTRSWSEEAHADRTPERVPDPGDALEATQYHPGPAHDPHGPYDSAPDYPPPPRPEYAGRSGGGAHRQAPEFAGDREFDRGHRSAEPSYTYGGDGYGRPYD